MTYNQRFCIMAATAMTLLLTGCSSTSNLPEGETLYTGMIGTQYNDMQKDTYYMTIQEETEAALACAPNGSFLGSPYMRTPFPIKLWIYNAFANSEKGVGKWMRNSFGQEPVLMSYVNPEVRALVARNLLRANGFFDAKVDYKTKETGKRKAKIQYDVTFNHLYTIDTVEYLGYPHINDSIIRATLNQSYIKPGEPFSVSRLDAERTRLGNLFRNNGNYFYRPAYSVYTADSISEPGKVKVRLQPDASMPDNAMKQWRLGHLNIVMRKSITEQPTDSFIHPIISVHYSGKKPPIKVKALLRDIKLRPKQMYSLSNYTESASIINSMGLFSMSDFTFTPKDTTDTCSVLDMTLNCIFDKPYDASLEANFGMKSNDRTGPGLILGLTKRNAFRGGEKLTLNIKGSYEWQTGKKVAGSSSTINSYEYGADIMIEYPRLETPFGLYTRHRFYSPPSTLFKLSGNVLNRADYFKMLTVTGAVTYKFQTSRFSHHELSPFLLDYNYLQHTTATFDSIMTANPAVYVSMRNQFVPKIEYSYTYSTTSAHRNPIVWQTTITESGNMLSLGYMAAGKDFNTKQKDLFGNPFAQFVKISSSLRKTWSLTPKSQLVGSAAAWIIMDYGNTERAPYSEQFYVGGANSIRAFTIRSIGPGNYVAPNTHYAYLDQTGDIKLEANLEYRFNIVGSLYGATFLDAGNIWLMKHDDNRPGAKFKADSVFKQLATGTGVGIRYDLDFFVIRLDLGIALHVPYETGKSGYYNIPKFKDGLGLHFAIGYPF